MGTRALLDMYALSPWASGIHIRTCAHVITTTYVLSFIAVAMNSRDRYKIIGLRKISHSIKQSC